MPPDDALATNGADGTSPPPRDHDTDHLGRLRHDLKGPLTVIRGHAQLLLHRMARLEGLDPGEQAWLLERGQLIDAAIIGLAVQIEQLGQEVETGSDGENDDGRELRRLR